VLCAVVAIETPITAVDVPRASAMLEEVEEIKSQLPNDRVGFSQVVLKG